MPSPTAHNYETDERLLPRIRPELRAYQQVYDGEPFWVIKDPVTLRYFRFDREEFFLIEQLKRPVTLDQLKEVHRQAFRTTLLSNQEIGQFIALLSARGLLVMTQPNRDEILYQSSQKRRRGKLIATISNFMFFRIPLYDPDRLFDRMIERIRFLWTRTFLMFYLALVTLALVLLIKRWPEFTSMFQANFFTFRNLPVLFIALWCLKGLHEFGHGLTCKNFGGEAHELGFLFMVFAPFLYCNVTDSWTFSSKAHRLLVTGGGILTEVFFAALATIIWYLTDQPGFCHALMFNIMLACSFGTILFNANPLLRYDGYYLLMDILEVPNLRKRANTYLRNLFVRYVLAGEPQDRDEQSRYRFVFPVYAFAAYVYRWFILVIILYAIYKMLGNIHLEAMAWPLMTISGLSMLVMPLVKGTTGIAKERRALGISNVRLLMLLVLIITVAALMLFWPVQQQVTLNFILEPAQVHWLRSGAQGRLQWAAYVKEGALVDPDGDQAVLAQLDNPQLQYEKLKLDAEIEQTQARIAQLKARVSASGAEQLQDRLAGLLKNRQLLLERIDALQVRAPFAATILTADYQMHLLQGKVVGRGEPLMLLAAQSGYNAKVWVPEKTWARIFKADDELGQQAELMLYGFSGQKFTGRVIDVSDHSEDNMGQFGEKMALSNKVGGEVLTEYDPLVKSERPIEAVYEVTIALDEHTLPDAARAYMSGRAHIDCGKSTFYQWARDSVLRFISPEVRL